MKGIIVYSSKTGNTKKMAEFMYNEFKKRNSFDVDIADVNDSPDISQYDFALIGGYVDKGYPDRKARKLIESDAQKNMGVFATMGAMPDSPHGHDVSNNIDKLLKEKNSLGGYLCPGLVDPKLIQGIRGIKGAIIPPKVKEQMIDASVNSRWATEEELMGAADYFYNNIENMMK